MPTKKTATKKKAPIRKKVTAKKSPKRDSLAAFRDHMREDKVMEYLVLADDDALANIKGHISTQSIALNKALGLQGLPRGRLIEISGDEHTGKSTLLDHVFAETQRLGGLSILIDPEVGRDAKYTRGIGVDAEKLVAPQPKGGAFFTVEQVFSYIGRTCDYFAKHDPEAIVTIGVDSIAGLPTEEDVKRAAGEVKPGDAAKSIRHGLRTTIQRIARTGVTLVFVNQLYDKIGSFGFDSRKEYGGRGIPYHASVRVRLNRMGAIKKSSGEVVGSISQATIRKSKVSGQTGAKVKFGIIHSQGIDNTWSLHEALVAEGYVSHKKGSAWFTLQTPEGEVKYSGGHFGLAEKLADNPELYAHLVQVYASCVAS